MSLTNYVYFVEWNDFKKVYEQNKNSDFIGEAIEIEPNWLSEPENVSVLRSFMFINTEMEPVFRKRKNELSAQARISMEASLGLLCIDVRPAVMDLGKYDGEGWIYSILSPNTVDQLLSSIDFSLTDEFVQQFEENRQIVQMYFSQLKQLLQSAQSKHKGILVLTA